ncbi:aldehyde dehydrogenase family protein, partial [Methylobacterium sp. WL18]|uniref:aldehyde dehydrogenase family protein n=1 Tax=Methylobacterium sp. WL18 TaxID=2603897 RepID=UPI0011C7C73C
MTVRGENLIGAQARRGTQAAFRAVEAATGNTLEPEFPGASLDDLDRACALADSAFDTYRETAPEARAAFLEAIAANILDIGDDLVTRCMAETGLPRPRIEGERGRTVGQLRLFAGVLREGSAFQIRIDPALPDRKPLPRPDLRLRMLAVGPVAVFGASNFPLAFSVAGGDTASALAAGCPVIVKAHPAHPGTSELVGRAIQKAVAASGLPEGVFSLLFDAGQSIGQGLVADPRIAAVGFTGSRRGGTALMEIAAKRPRPIPVYAEMSSINPVLLFPGALAARGEAIGRAFAASLTLGAGQFCTNPGLLIGIAGSDLEAFAEAAATAIRESAPHAMLTADIRARFERGVAEMAGRPGVTVA